jgi:hypothetical protein
MNRRGRSRFVAVKFASSRNVSPRRDAFFIGQRTGICDTGNDLSLTKFDHGRARVLALCLSHACWDLA